MLEGQGSDDLSDELVIGTESEFRVGEKNIELLLETVEQLVLDELHSDLRREVVEAVVLGQEGVGRTSEVLTRVKLPSIDGATVDPLVTW